jgi:hypothetical protein
VLAIAEADGAIVVRAGPPPHAAVTSRTAHTTRAYPARRTSLAAPRRGVMRRAPVRDSPACAGKAHRRHDEPRSSIQATSQRPSAAASEDPPIGVAASPHQRAGRAARTLDLAAPQRQPIEPCDEAPSPAASARRATPEATVYGRPRSGQRACRPATPHLVDGEGSFAGTAERDLRGDERADAADADGDPDPRAEPCARRAIDPGPAAPLVETRAGLAS